MNGYDQEISLLNFHHQPGIRFGDLDGCSLRPYMSDVPDGRIGFYMVTG